MKTAMLWVKDDTITKGFVSTGSGQPSEVPPTKLIEFIAKAQWQFVSAIPFGNVASDKLALVVMRDG